MKLINFAKNRCASGYTLIELMIVVAIIGLLLALAVPSYQQYVVRANRADAKDMLTTVMFEMERFATRNRTYTTNLIAVGFGSDPEMSPEDYYSITAATCPGGATIANCVLLTATPMAGGPQVADGALTLDSNGQRLPANLWDR